MIFACSCGASEVERTSSASHVILRADAGLALTNFGYLCAHCREYLSRVPCSPEVAHARPA